MKAAWRPENWKNPNSPIIVVSSDGGDPSAFSAYEAGADAMLNALKETGHQVRDYGVIIFIPNLV